MGAKAWVSDARERACPACRDPLAQCGQETSLTENVKLFSADRGHHVPAPEGWMSGLPFLVCVSLLSLLVALVGRSWCHVAPGCSPGVSPVFRGCFSVTSEADPSIRFSRAPTQEPASFGQVHPAAAKTDGCLTASFSSLLGCVDVLGLRFSLHCCFGSGKQCQWRRCGVPRAVCCGRCDS